VALVSGWRGCARSCESRSWRCSTLPKMFAIQHCVCKHSWSFAVASTHLRCVYKRASRDGCQLCFSKQFQIGMKCRATWSSECPSYIYHCVVCRVREFRSKQFCSTASEVSHPCACHMRIWVGSHLSITKNNHNHRTTGIHIASLRSQKLRSKCV